ncbi:MAG: Ku protein [Bdellovibrionales bacterium]
MKKAKRKNAPRKRKAASRSKKDTQRRGLWKGSIAFGLVNIPIILESAQQEQKIHFRLIDKRNHAPIGYKQINKATGKPVTRTSIVKGFEYEKGRYVLINDADFKKANVRATRTIDIEDFVELKDIDPMLFEKPYYVLPQKGGEKGYVLLREVLKRTGRAAVAKVVLHKVQHLVTIMPRGDYLILEILRFSNEVIETHEMDNLDASVHATKVSPREVTIAEQLVEGMSSEWRPDKYENTYHDDLMKLIKAKIKRGTTTKLEEVESTPAEEETPSNVFDLTSLLKKSLNTSKRHSRRRSSEEDTRGA